MRMIADYSRNLHSNPRSTGRGILWCDIQYHLYTKEKIYRGYIQRIFRVAIKCPAWRPELIGLMKKQIEYYKIFTKFPLCGIFSLQNTNFCLLFRCLIVCRAKQMNIFSVYPACADEVTQGGKGDMNQNFPHIDTVRLLIFVLTRV